MGKSLDELASYFRPQVDQFLAECAAAGIPLTVEDTGRTPEEQAVHLINGTSKTQHSRHLPQPPEDKSEAIDVVPTVCLPMKYWGWTGDPATSHPAWARIIDIGTRLGLSNGYRMWGWDPGHFQYNHPTIQETT